MEIVRNQTGVLYGSEWYLCVGDVVSVRVGKLGDGKRDLLIYVSTAALAHSRENKEQ